MEMCHRHRERDIDRLTERVKRENMFFSDFNFPRDLRFADLNT